MSLVSLAVRRPVSTLMFYTGIVLAGAIALSRLPVDFLPPLSVPKLTVRTAYPDTAPEEVEHAITRPLEAALGTVPGVRRIRSVTREGMSLVGLEFAWGTDMDFAVLTVREKLDQVRVSFPRDAGRPTILRIDPSTEPVMSIAVASAADHAAGGPHELEELRETAQVLVKRRLEQAEGVAQASVIGGVEREIHVDVDPAMLQMHGISIDQVAGALASANVNFPGGAITKGQFRYALRTLGACATLQDLRDVVVRFPEGRRRPLRVGDCATVHDAYRERTGYTRFDGKEVVVVQVRKEAGANTVDVCTALHAVLAQLRHEYPSLSLTVIADQAVFIRRSIDDVQQAIAVGALLVFLVLFVVLRQPRYPLIIGLTMPVSILATIVAMSLVHITLNIISLAGLALGIGMLGDNAIVVLENVTRLREQGMPLSRATLMGAREMGTAVTASTLTNVAIFLPVICVEGVAAQLFVDMGVTMAIALLVSLVVAGTLVPMLISREGMMDAPRLREAFGAMRSSGRRVLLPVLEWSARLDGAIRRGVERYLWWALEHRAAVLWGTLLTLGISVFAALRIPSESAPPIDQHRFVVRVQMPRGTSLDGTSACSSMLEHILRALPGVQGVFATIGVPDEHSFWTVEAGSVDASMLEIIVDPRARTEQLVAAVRGVLLQLSRTTTGIDYALQSRGTTFDRILRPDADNIRCRIIGPNAAAVRQIADRYADRVRLIPGLVDLRSSLQKGTPEYHLSVDRATAWHYGLTVHDVAAHLMNTLRGVKTTGLTEFDRKIPLRVRHSSLTHSSIRDVLATPLITPTQGIPVRALVTWEEAEGYAEIWRENQQQACVMVANVSGRSIHSVVRDLERAAAQMHLPRGYAIIIGGENEDMRESFESLGVVMLLSILVVFMILAAEYESILYPLVILLTSPLAFVGAIAAMAAAGEHHTVMSLVGLVIMIGAVDNDAVIVVDRFMALRRRGATLADAIQEGMRQRLRPILMTTATTVLGIVPVMFDMGSGSELVRALTIPLVGGLIASTIFTIATIPVVFAVLDRWGIGRMRRAAV